MLKGEGFASYMGYIGGAVLVRQPSPETTACAVRLGGPEEDVLGGEQPASPPRSTSGLGSSWRGGVGEISRTRTARAEVGNRIADMGVEGLEIGNLVLNLSPSLSR